MGTSIAMQVARRSDPLKQPVLLLERSHLAAGSTGRSGAILRQHYSDRELAGMARDSLREYSGFRARTGYSVGFQACGVLTLAGPGSPGSVELVRENVRMQQTLGIDTRLVDAAEIRALARGIQIEEQAIGAFEPGAGVCDPKRTVESFASLARYYGATTRSGEDVLEVLVEAGRVCGVRTRTETIEADQVVLAAGPWSRGLLEPLGIELPLRVLGPQQHFVEALDVGGGASGSARPEVSPPLGDPGEPSIPGALLLGGGLESLGDPDLEGRFEEPEPDLSHAHPVILDLEAGHYARCDPQTGQTRVGKMDYTGMARLEDPADLPEAVSGDFQRWAREALVERMPAYAERADTGGQLGWYTVTPDAQPMLGPWPGIEGLYLVAGFSGHGFKLAPSVGLGLTQMLFGEPVSAFDTGFFAPTRFASAPPEWGGRYGI